MAQPPQRMTYQAIIRNSNNELVANQQIGIRVSILQDNINGGAVFMEKHTVTTNAYGLATIQIGAGTPLLVNTLAGIEWGKHNFFVKTEVDITGGTNYTIVGTQQLLTVPYSFYSESAHKVDTALYAAAAGSATTSITASFANTAHTAIYADTADYSAQSNYSANAYNSIYADTAKFLLNAQNSDTAKFAYNSDTANYATAAEYADTTDYTLNSNHAIYADTADYVLNSNHAIYADTADYVLNSNHAIYADTADFNNLLNKPAGTNKGDILYWDTLDMAWHIVPAGNPGEVLTMDTNSVPYWNASATPVVTLPTVTTDSVYNIIAPTALAAISVTSDGGSMFVFSGVCWDTVHNPTVANSHTLDGIGIGQIISSITGLALGSTYYVRAFATNSAGTVYGAELACLIADFPKVTTTTASDITTTTAVIGGVVTDDGGATVTERGVCWNTTGNPTIADNVLQIGSGIGSFIDTLKNLNITTKYYVRAYAINSVGIAYGETESFTTLWPCGISTVKDYDDNTYNTVQLGNQCWMRENLKTEHYADGTSISQGSSSSTNTPYWYYPNGSSSNKSKYGLIYNWTAVMHGEASSADNPSGVQGICPTGWHVPSDDEWTELTNYVSSQSQYVCGGTSTFIAKALAAKTNWISHSGTCTVGNDLNANNDSGFSGLPAGGYYGSYGNFGSDANWWSSTENSSIDANCIFISYTNAQVFRVNFYEKYYALSVRCLKD